MNPKQSTARTIRAVIAAGALTVLGLTAAAPAAAQVFVGATLTAGMHLRAGPSIFYPSVMMLAPGTTVQVFGCEQGFNWCDVQIGPNRGWVDAAFLQTMAPSGPVFIASSGPVLGIPVSPFVFNTYWSTWYPTRPWYSRRAFYASYWNRFPHGRPPPIYRPRPRPPMVRPPPARPMQRPPAVVRPPPGGTVPPSGRPPPSARPPPSGRPTSGDRPPDRGQPPPGSSPRP